VSWIHRFSNLFRDGRLHRELDEELQFHIEARIRDNLAAGMTPQNARRDALRRFGNQTVTRERMRERDIFGWLDAAWRDLRYAARTLRKNPGVTVVAVLSLALGIGANTAIFSLIDMVLLKTLPVARPEQLYVLQPAGRQGLGAFSYAGFQTLRDANQVFSDVFTCSEEGERWNVIHNGQAELATGQLVTGNYFSALGVRAIAGRVITPADDNTEMPVAVISYSYWKRKFALDASALGSSLTVNGISLTIIGVAPAEFFGVAVGFAPEIWAPMSLQPRLSHGESLLDAGTWWLLAMGRLKPGVSEQQARANLEVLVPAVQQAMRISDRFGFDHFSRIELGPGGAGISALRREFSVPLRILMIVVALVLLIACANVANLLLARANARQAEMAIRIALGGGRARLMRQLLTESMLLAMMGGVVGLVFALWSSNLLIAFLASSRLTLTLRPHLDLRMLAFTGAVSIATGILFGVAPALRATRIHLAPALKENSRSLAGTRMNLGKVLVVLQVAVCLVLLTGAGLFVGTLQNLRTKDLGFNSGNILLMTLEPALAGYKDATLTSLYQQLMERIDAVPGVRSASLSRWGLIGAGYAGRNVSIPGYTPQTRSDQNTGFNVVGPRFFETNGIPLSAGREFAPADTAAAPRVAIVNQKFARFYFGRENPIGKRFTFPPRPDQPFEIVGVVGDAKYFQLRKQIPRMVFVPFLQSSGMSRMIVAVRTAANPTSMVSILRREIQAIAKDVPISSVRTQEQQLDATLVQERLLATLAGFFSLLALVLTCVGLYGILSYAVTRRTNEIGVRVALGASYNDVLWLILRDSVLLVGIGLAIGAVGTLATTRLISKMLFGLAPHDPATIAAGALLLSAVVAFAGWLPARRAARVDPMVALRYE
jgi:predicted permease